MKAYTFECRNANGIAYVAPLRGFNRLQAAARMREAKAVFTGCTDWKLRRAAQ